MNFDHRHLTCFDHGDEKLHYDWKGLKCCALPYQGFYNHCVVKAWLGRQFVLSYSYF
jgi:hypothetical protein